MAAELAAKKINLTHVETKDLSVPNVQKTDSSSSSANTGKSMMAMIMAQRNGMKKKSGVGSNLSASTQVKTAPPKPAALKPTNTVKTNPPPKPTPKPVPKPALKPVTKPPTTTTAPKKPTITSNSSSSKPPMKIGGGGGGFAAMRNMLASRMGPPAAQKKTDEPKKPIVELASGSNVPRMNLSKLMESLENNITKSQTVDEPVQVICNTSGGVPPPPSQPPPPPPPPKSS